MKKICIVLVNFNGHVDTVECLESVLKSDYPHYQIVVVDNSDGPHSISQLQQWAEGKRELLKTELPQFVLPSVPKPVFFTTFSENEFFALEKVPEQKLILVRAKKNYGFAGGNNIALRYLLKFESYDFGWLLNNDTVVRPDTLQNYVAFMSQDRESVGIAGGKLFNYYHPARLQGVGGKYNKWFGRIEELGAGEMDNGQWDKLELGLDYVIGASMFVRKEFIHSTGLLDELYFLYFEELDWAIRGARKGWKMALCPSAHIFHKMGASTGSGEDSSALSDFFSIRNRILISRKFFPIAQLTLYPSFLLFVFNRIKRRKPDRIKLLFRLILNPKQAYKKSTD